MSTHIKVYVVQRIRPDGTEDPRIVAVKLTHHAAHLIARQFAPARVKPLVADKSGDVNGETLDAAAEAAEGTGYGADWYLQDRHVRVCVE